MCHEYGYFSIIGTQYQALLTTADYFANGVLWLPLAVYGIFFWIDWTHLREEPPPPRDWKKKSTWLFTILLVSASGYGLAIFTWPIEFTSAIYVMIIAGTTWSYVWRGQAARFANLEPPFDSVARVLVRVGPPLLLLMFIMGSMSAGTDLTRVDQPYAFYLKDDQLPQLRIFLRNFDKGVLVRNARNNTIEFFKWDTITSITRHAPQKSRTLFCAVSDLLGYPCEEPTPSP